MLLTIVSNTLSAGPCPLGLDVEDGGDEPVFGAVDVVGLFGVVDVLDLFGVVDVPVPALALLDCCPAVPEFLATH